MVDVDRRGWWTRAVITLLAVPALLVPPVSASATTDSRTAQGAQAAAAGHARTTPYVNPVSRRFADTFADPAVIRGPDGWWYAFGTTDPLREGEGTRHLLPIARSRDLVSWTYVRDAFTEDTLPAWADRSRNASLWAPEIVYSDGLYRLYYVVTDTTVTGEPNDNAIGMATARHPAGPWTDSGGPVVGPRRGSENPGDFLWTFDPEAVRDTDGTWHLFYGSYYGGIWVQRLTADGRRVVEGTATRVAIDNKFEGANVVRRGGWWYLFASTANCCAGPVTGYSVQVGRSRSLAGPYVDRLGVSLNVSRAGGTPVIAPNGNRWIGTGHNDVVRDLAGQDWFFYHAIDRSDPYLDGTEGINERPMLLDRLDWIGGWPTVRGGRWASETLQRGPVAQGPVRHRPVTRPVIPAPEPRVGRLDPARSDEFNGPALRPGWTHVRDRGVTTLTGGALRWPVENTDLVGPTNDASVLVRDAPAGGWTVETKVTVDLGTDVIRNFQQAGVIVYAGDDDFGRLSHVAIWNTRQTEYGREMPYAGRLVYGGTIVGPPADTTWLRLTHTVDRRNGEHEVRASTSNDGRRWVHGGVWTWPAGTDLQVGLVAHGGQPQSPPPPATADFDYFRLYRH